MIPVVLRTERLVLDQPTEADVPLIAEYCQDPLFERYLTTPWPYREEHAREFVHEFVPNRWAEDREYTWAIRHTRSGPLLGVVGSGVTHDGIGPWHGGIGFWVGAPHRGRGYVTEAARAVLDWAFERGAARIAWECVVGNVASAAVARKCGFRYTGERPVRAWRDSSRPPAWHGELDASDDRTEKDGWPA
jgi:RimJ/RimL family protein N-acetyltransferase